MRGEGFYHDVIESLEEYGILTLDLSGTVTTWNGGARRIFGYEPDEIIGQPGERLFTPEDVSRGVASGEMESALREGRAPDERWHLRRDGSRFWASGMLFPLLREGKPAGFVKVFRDRTRNKRLEQLSHSSESSMRLLVDSLPTLVAYVTRDQRYAFNNVAYEEWFGRPPEEITGLRIKDVIGDEAYEVIRPHLEDALAGKRNDFESLIPYKGGGRRWVRVSYIPDSDPTDQVCGVIALGVDITDRKRVEDRLREARDSLGVAVEERTRELKSMVSELERFTYTVAHDLRAPLRAVHRHAEMVLSNNEAPPTAALRENLSSITAGVKRMDRMIADLLNYSKIGQAQLKLEPIDLGDLTGDVLSQLQTEISERRAEVMVRLNGARPLADRVLLSQVLINLLANALKFVPKGRIPRVEIGSKQAGDRLELWVKDNGIGIETQYHERLFNLFERLHAQDEYAGTGIGLAIVARAVERLGGRVSVDSAPDEGSTFRVELRAAP